MEFLEDPTLQAARERDPATAALFDEGDHGGEIASRRALRALCRMTPATLKPFRARIKDMLATSKKEYGLRMLGTIGIEDDEEVEDHGGEPQAWSMGPAHGDATRLFILAQGDKLALAPLFPALPLFSNFY